MWAVDREGKSGKREVSYAAVNKEAARGCLAAFVAKVVQL